MYDQQNLLWVGVIGSFGCSFYCIVWSFQCGICHIFEKTPANCKSASLKNQLLFNPIQTELFFVSWDGGRQSRQKYWGSFLQYFKSCKRSKLLRASNPPPRVWIGLMPYLPLAWLTPDSRWCPTNSTISLQTKFCKFFSYFKTFCISKQFKIVKFGAFAQKLLHFYVRMYCYKNTDGFFYQKGFN